MKLTRNYVTPSSPYIPDRRHYRNTDVFHLFDGYIGIVHEYLGMLFMLAALGVLAVSVLFIVGESRILF